MIKFPIKNGICLFNLRCKQKRMRMRSLLLFTLTMAGGLLAGAQQTYFSCDFENGIPEGMSLYDQDGNEPSTDMKALGFAVGTPWITVDDGAGGKAACSTSWYRTAGQSDDWMVTPSIEVTSPTAVLRWRAKAVDKDYRDGYAVYVSTEGNSPDKFDRSAPALSVKSETADWTSRELPLAEYAGKKIWIAFVNNSRDKSRLLIDDIYAGVPSVLEIHSTLPRVVSAVGDLEITGEITNTSDADITGYTVKYNIGNDFEGEQSFDNTIKAGRTRTFSIITDYEIGKNETIDYEVTVECKGDAASDKGKVSAYTRRIVAEEVTGVWCAYCIRGMVAMAQMKQDYGDSFLGIAVHGGSAKWEDPMAMQEYTDWLFSGYNMSGYPHCTVNRQMSTTGDPANMPTYYRKALATENFIGIGLDADVDATAGKITAKTDIFTAKDLEDVDYRLAYLLIENDVHNGEVLYDKDGNPSEYNGYEQNNNVYSGSGESMGGYEDLPTIIPGAQMTYQDVARYISPDYNGIEGSFPTSLVEGEKASHEFTFDIPESVMKKENTELAVMLINRKTASVLNAEVLPLKKFFMPEGITETSMNTCDLRISATAAGFAFVSAAGIEAVTLYGTDGMRLAEASVNGAYTEVTVERGRMVIARVTLSDGTCVTRKLTR